MIGEWIVIICILWSTVTYNSSHQRSDFSYSHSVHHNRHFRLFKSYPYQLELFYFTLCAFILFLCKLLPQILRSFTSSLASRKPLLPHLPIEKEFLFTYLGLRISTMFFWRDSEKRSMTKDKFWVLSIGCIWSLLMPSNIWSWTKKNYYLPHSLSSASWEKRCHGQT